MSRIASVHRKANKVTRPDSFPLYLMIPEAIQSNNVVPDSCSKRGSRLSVGQLASRVTAEADIDSAVIRIVQTVSVYL